jgi:hypothetical protein
VRHPSGQADKRFGVFAEDPRIVGGHENELGQKFGGALEVGAFRKSWPGAALFPRQRLAGWPIRGGSQSGGVVARAAASKPQFQVFGEAQPQSRT